MWQLNQMTLGIDWDKFTGFDLQSETADDIQ